MSIYQPQIDSSQLVDISFTTLANPDATNLLETKNNTTQDFKAINLPTKATPGRKTLFLDLDDTLVKLVPFSSLSRYPTISRTERPYFSLCMHRRGQMKHMVGFVRRGAREFLKEMAALYEVCVFTAADKDYAEAVVAELDPEGSIFSCILSREHCTEIERGHFLKQLSRVHGRRAEDMVLVDDTFEHLEENFANSLEISKFGEDLGEDDELPALAQLLKDIFYESDLRGAISEIKKALETMSSEEGSP